MEATPVDPITLVQLVQSEPHTYKLAGPTRLRFDREMEGSTERKEFLEGLFDMFSPALANIAETEQTTDVKHA